MRNFVLVHGAYHGGWCWYKVAASLERRGHHVFAPDLPGSGRDHSAGDPPSLDDYVARVVDVIEHCEGPVTLVGHSMGGTVITAAAEARPDKIERLVYVAAALSRSGESLFSTLASDHPTLIHRNIVASADGTSSTVREEGLRETFYDDCSDEDVMLARLSVTPQANAPMATPVEWTEARFGAIPRAYVECTRDKTICIDLQREMTAAMPCAELTSLDSAHSPFFSMPEALADAIEGTPRRS